MNSFPDNDFCASRVCGAANALVFGMYKAKDAWERMYASLQLPVNPSRVSLPDYEAMYFQAIGEVEKHMSSLYRCCEKEDRTAEIDDVIKVAGQLHSSRNAYVRLFGLAMTISLHDYLHKTKLTTISNLGNGPLRIGVRTRIINPKHPLELVDKVRSLIELYR